VWYEMETDIEDRIMWPNGERSFYKIGLIFCRSNLLRNEKDGFNSLQFRRLDRS